MKSSSSIAQHSLEGEGATTLASQTAKRKLSCFVWYHDISFSDL